MTAYIHGRVEDARLLDLIVSVVKNQADDTGYASRTDVERLLGRPSADAGIHDAIETLIEDGRLQRARSAGVMLARAPQTQQERANETIERIVGYKRTTGSPYVDPPAPDAGHERPKAEAIPEGGVGDGQGRTAPEDMPQPEASLPCQCPCECQNQAMPSHRLCWGCWSDGKDRGAQAHVAGVKQMRERADPALD